MILLLSSFELLEVVVIVIRFVVVVAAAAVWSRLFLVFDFAGFYFGVTRRNDTFFLIDDVITADQHSNDATHFFEFSIPLFLLLDHLQNKDTPTSLPS